MPVKIFVTRGRSFQTYVGSLSHAQTVALEKVKSGVVSWVEGQMPLIDGDLSAVTYFAGGRTRQFPGFQDDYEAARVSVPLGAPLVSSTAPEAAKPAAEAVQAFVLKAGALAWPSVAKAVSPLPSGAGEGPLHFF